MSEATSPGRVRFSWFAFVITLLALYPSSILWLAERTARYKSLPGTVNWYAAVPPVAFYGVVVGLPLAVATINGLLVARWRKAGIVGAAMLTIAVTVVMRTAVPTFDRLNQAAGGRDQRVCRSNLARLGSALRMYADDHDGGLPPPQSWPDALRGGWVHGPDRVFFCPADARLSGEPGPQDFPTSYTLYRFDVWPRLEFLDRPETIPLMFDGRTVCGDLTDAEFRHPAIWMGVRVGGPGLNMLFADGHVAWVGQQD